jgi:perosamine synthetase
LSTRANIPVFAPTLGNDELDNAIQAIKEGAISGSFGRFIPEFEEGFAHYCGAKYGVATTSGTTALHLALKAYGIGSGDQVILPTFTNIATCLAVVYAGATPVVVDSERRTWNMDVTQVDGLINSKTRAIMPVHIYGHPVDMDPLIDSANKHDLLIIEDAAEAHGAEYKGKRVGAMKDAGCFSFYANKIITTGEGGMVLTNHEEAAERARMLRDLAFRREKRFLHFDMGFNYRMSNLHAALGVAQIKKTDAVIEQKRELAAKYTSRLSEVEGLTLPVEEPWAKNVYWMYSLLIEDNFGVTRDTVMARLLSRGIETRPFFVGMHEQPAFHDIGLFVDQVCPVAEDIAEKGLYLPSGLDLTEEQVDYICECLREVQATAAVAS